MGSSGIRYLLMYLWRFQESWDSDPDMRDIVERIKLKIDLLISWWPVDEHGFLQVSVPEALIPQLKQVRMDIVCVSGEQRPTPTAGKLVLRNLDKLRFIKPEIEQMYSVAFKSSRSTTSEFSEDVLSLISLLSGNLGYTLSSNADILVPVRPQILALQDELIFLRNFLDFISRIRGKQLFNKDLLIFAQAVAVNFSYLLHCIRLDKRMDEEMEIGVKTELLDLSEKLNRHQQPELRLIYLRKLEGTDPKLLTARDDECVLRFLDYMIENLGKTIDKANLEFTAKNQIEILREELSFLRLSPKNLLNYEATEKLDFLINKTRYFIYSSAFIDNKFGDLALDEKLGGLKIDVVKSESHHFNMPQSWQSNFPETNELESVDSIIKNLKQRLHSTSALIDQLATEVNTIYEELLALRNDFGRVSKHWNENEELKALFSRYRDVAYQAEYFVDSFRCGVVPFWSQKMGLANLVRDLSSIKKELKFFLNDNVDHGTGRSISFITPRDESLIVSGVLDSEYNARNIKEKDFDQLVGFEDERKKMIDNILGGSYPLTILSIIGMPGLGKTTIANSVYRDPSVTAKFYVRAWCSVSQVYNKEELLLKILHQIEGKSEANHGKDEKCFDQKLYKSLKGKRYLVVIDDIWDIDAWNDLRPSFPNDNNGSRIIFTTRNQRINVEANSVSHALRLLNDEESWKLLQVRVFKKQDCPQELFQVGKKIVENCKGLPLTVVLVAGLLKVIERKKDSWEQFAKVLISREVDYPSEQHPGILDLSYRHLPDYLRPCFLYFGSFPEDATIPVWKLVRLWIAEGFVQPKAGVDSLELEAENYLNALIDRSLVMIAKRSYNGRAKACHIHDLLHDFCTDKAREERFLLKMKRGDSLSTLTDYEAHEQYRLCIVQSNTWTVPLVRTRHFESRIRSLQFSVEVNLHENPSSIWFTEFSMPSSSIFPPPSVYGFRGISTFYVIAVFRKFRLLRVLDLGTLDIVAEDSFKTIIQLIHLRFLSLGAFIKEIPAEIENLTNLETFLLTVTTTSGYVVLPETIWNMVNLKHIRIRSGATVLFPSEFIENSNMSNGLTSLSKLLLHPGNEIEKMVKKLPNLKQLKCTISGSQHHNWVKFWFCNPVLALDSLHQLEELSLDVVDKQLIVFPPSLKQLTLRGFALSWDEAYAIGSLPNLEDLKLKYMSLGEVWHMKVGDFKRLKFLTLDRVEICVWDASLEDLPCLEKLVVKTCRNLEELPSIGESSFLRMIDVRNCSTSVVDSAQKIQEQQYQLGNDKFILSISGAASAT